MVGSKPVMILLSRGYLAMSPDTLIITTGGGERDVSGIWWLQVMDAAKHPTMHKQGLLPQQRII